MTNLILDDNTIIDDNISDDNISDDNISDDNILDNGNISNTSNIIDNNIFNNDNIIDENDFDDIIFKKYLQRKKKVKESKRILIELNHNNENVKEYIDVIIKRNIFIDHIKGKLSKLYQRIRLIELKNNKYKRCYNCFNICIILLSTSLTIASF